MAVQKQLRCTTAMTHFFNLAAIDSIREDVERREDGTPIQRCDECWNLAGKPSYWDDVAAALAVAGESDGLVFEDPATGQAFVTPKVLTA